jgi:hypothetical protein
MAGKAHELQIYVGPGCLAGPGPIPLSRPGGHRGSPVRPPGPAAVASSLNAVSNAHHRA